MISYEIEVECSFVDFTAQKVELVRSSCTSPFIYHISNITIVPGLAASFLFFIMANPELALYSSFIRPSNLYIVGFFSLLSWK